MLIPTASSSLITGGAAATYAYVTSAQDASNTTTYSFSGVSIGTASAGRTVVVAFASRAAGTTPIAPTVTIGGISATEVVRKDQTFTNTNIAALYAANVPTGTTADIVVTSGVTMLRAGIGVWECTGVSLTAADTATDGLTQLGTTMSGNVTVPAGGFLIAAASITQGVATTWTNATERYDDAVEASNLISTGADDNTAGSRTITATFSTNNNEDAFVIAAWG